MKRPQHLVNEEALFSDSSVHTDFFSDSYSTSCSVDFNQKQVTSVAQIEKLFSLTVVRLMEL